MADTKFTPGPWHPGHLGSDGKCQCRSILAEGYMGCIATVEVDNGKSVSDGGNDAPPIEEAVANMHLIAAAPELYALAEAFGDNSISDAEFNRMRHAALAKARGEAE